MSANAHPFPDLQPNPRQAEHDEHVQEFQAAMYRMLDCLHRVGSNPFGSTGHSSALDYVDRQLMICQSNLDAARIAVTNLVVVSHDCDVEARESENRFPIVPPRTPDGSGRNVGGAP